jgi:hypothetical protein
MRKFRWITIAVCAILLIATFMGAPLLGSQITGGSLIYSGYPEAKASFLVILACSLLSLFLPRNRIAKRVADIAPLVLSAVSFVYGVTRSAVAVWQSSYPFSHTYVGLIASVLSALIYLCLGLSIWAAAGLMSRR